MTYELIALCVSTRATPPSSAYFRRIEGRQFIAGISNTDRVLTVDVSVWRDPQIGSHESITRTCPDKDWIEYVSGLNGTMLLGLTKSEEFRGLTNRAEEKPLKNTTELSTFRRVGFDVVDSAGLSGLANVSFALSEMQETDLSSSDFTNEGILVDERCASRICEYLDRHAGEHAPFYPLEVWARLSAGERAVW